MLDRLGSAIARRIVKACGFLFGCDNFTVAWVGYHIFSAVIILAALVALVWAGVTGDTLTGVILTFCMFYYFWIFKTHRAGMRKFIEAYRDGHPIIPLELITANFFGSRRWWLGWSLFAPLLGFYMTPAVFMPITISMYSLTEYNVPNSTLKSKVKALLGKIRGKFHEIISIPTPLPTPVLLPVPLN